MTSPIFKYAWYKFHIGWIIIQLIVLLGLLIISIFSEVPEIFKWGFELGYFLFPIFSSVLISIIIYFFTSHLKDAEKEFYQFDQFEFLRETIIEILASCHNKFGDKTNSPKFNETNLGDYYSIILSEKELNQQIWNRTLDKLINIRQNLSLLIHSCNHISKSNRLDGLNSNFYDLLNAFNSVLQSFNNESDIFEERINPLIQNLIYLLGKTNSEVLASKDYQKYYKLKKQNVFCEIKLKREIIVK